MSDKAIAVLVLICAIAVAVGMCIGVYFESRHNVPGNFKPTMGAVPPTKWNNLQQTNSSGPCMSPEWDVEAKGDCITNLLNGGKADYCSWAAGISGVGAGNQAEREAGLEPTPITNPPGNRAWTERELLHLQMWLNFGAQLYSKGSRGTTVLKQAYLACMNFGRPTAEI